MTNPKFRIWAISLTLAFYVDGVPAQQPAGGAQVTSFCRQQYLKDRDGNLYCNWGTSFANACDIHTPKDRIVPQGAVIKAPESSGKCADGRAVVKVIHNKQADR
jgi:hypothetical protein